MDEVMRARLLKYVNTYRTRVWGMAPVDSLSDEALITIDVRSDGYANAHVEGEHEAWNICRYDSARECGERCAAAEWVECN